MKKLLLLIVSNLLGVCPVEAQTRPRLMRPVRFTKRAILLTTNQLRSGRRHVAYVARPQPALINQSTALRGRRSLQLTFPLHSGIQSYVTVHQNGYMHCAAPEDIHVRDKPCRSFTLPGNSVQPSARHDPVLICLKDLKNRTSLSAVRSDIQANWISGMKQLSHKRWP